MQLRALLLLPVLVQIAQSNGSQKQCECGRAPSNRIVNGAVLKNGTYPWMASFVENSNPKFSYCGATIVSQKFVLTASHCVRGKQESDCSILVGAYDVANPDPTYSKLMAIEKFNIYESNRTGNIIFEEDLTVVKLSKALDYNSKVQPICLPTKGGFYQGLTAVVAGYGSTDAAKPDTSSAVTIPRTIDVTVHNATDCKANLYNQKQFTFDDEIMCAGSAVKDQSVCQGDSGGSLMRFDGPTGRWKIIAVLTATAGGCTTEHYALYTNVTYFIDFVLNVTEGTGCQI